MRAKKRNMHVGPRETESILFHFYFPIGYISLPILDSLTLHHQPEYTPLVQTSAISLNRLIVDLVAAAAGVLPFRFPNTSAMLPSCSVLTFVGTGGGGRASGKSQIEVATHETTYAPPAKVLLQLRQFQIPTEWRLTVTLPQKVHVYLFNSPMPRSAYVPLSSGLTLQIPTPGE